MKILLIVSLAIAVTSSAIASPPDSTKKNVHFGIGSPVNEYPEVEWIKGPAVKQFDKKKIYIVECWATWCGPCVANIPHMNELYKKFKDKITFIGQDVWEDNRTDVVEFVNKKGDGLAYTIAYSGTADSTDFSRKWLDPAGIHGIPQVFVIQDNKIVWMPHPSEITEGALQLLIDRKFTIAGTKAFSPDTKYHLVRRLMKENKIDSANITINKLLQENPLDDEAIYDRCDLYDQQGRKTDKRNFIRDLVVKYPDNINLNYCWLDILKEECQWDSILIVTSRMFSLSPENKKGIIWYRHAAFMGKGDGAGDVLMMKEHVTDTSDHQIIRYMSMRLRRFPESISSAGKAVDTMLLSLCKIAIREQPANAISVIRLADLSWDLNDKEGAVQVLKQGLLAMQAAQRRKELINLVEQYYNSLKKGIQPNQEQINQWIQMAGHG